MTNKLCLCIAAIGGCCQARRGGVQDGSARRLSVGDLRDDATGVGPEPVPAAILLRLEGEAAAAEEHNDVRWGAVGIIIVQRKRKVEFE